MILDPRGRILIGQRGAEKSGAWQLPQGGIEPGEAPEQAVLREVQEETGLTRVRVIGRTLKWITYVWPVGIQRVDSVYIGQKQIYFALELHGGNEDPVPTRSFERFDWVEWDQVIDRALPLKRTVYARAWRELERIISRGVPTAR